MILSLSLLNISMIHKLKVKLARKLMSKRELIEGIPLFDSKNWNKRKRAIEERVSRSIERIKNKRGIYVERSGKSVKEGEGISLEESVVAQEQREDIVAEKDSRSQSEDRKDEGKDMSELQDIDRANGSVKEGEAVVLPNVYRDVSSRDQSSQEPQSEVQTMGEVAEGHGAVQDNSIGEDIQNEEKA